MDLMAYLIGLRPPPVPPSPLARPPHPITCTQSQPLALVSALFFPTMASAEDSPQRSDLVCAHKTVH